MPRMLTYKEITYIYRLIRRNYAAVKRDEKTDKLWYKGLSEPMSSSERMMRYRLRKKAIQMAIDLCLIWGAGIAPGGEIKDGNAAEFVSNVDLQLTLFHVVEDIEKGLSSWVVSILRRDFKGLRTY